MIKTPLSTMIGGAFWTAGATVVGGGTPTFDQQIAKLFAKGEQGFAFDPNDLSTMFQDAAGDIPVTAAGQPVGLMLDKSKGLALERILTNSNDFTIATDKWDFGDNVQFALNPSNGAARLTFNGSYQNAINHFGYGANRVNLRERFEISFDAVHISGGDLVATLGYGSKVVVSAASNGGVKRRYLFTLTNDAGGLNRAIIFSGDANVEATWEISNVSTAHVRGNHAMQYTSSMRPLLVASPQRLEYDTVDDKLTTTLPAQLTGCTVVRSVPNIGAQILTNQTIPATYEDNTDHCGLIVINRALTSSETSAIAAEFNKRAGV